MTDTNVDSPQAFEDVMRVKEKVADYDDVLIGLGRLAQAFKDDMTMYAILIMNDRRNESQRTVAVASYYQKFGHLPDTQAKMGIAWEEYEGVLKPRMQRLLSEAINSEIEAENREMQAKITKLQNEMLAQMRKTHQPHQLGTVNEIAQKYGISKSEVRRLKSEGKLEEFVQERESGSGKS
jgi:hypothetical protein